MLQSKLLAKSHRPWACGIFYLKASVITTTPKTSDWYCVLHAISFFSSLLRNFRTSYNITTTFVNFGFMLTQWICGKCLFISFIEHLEYFDAKYSQSGDDQGGYRSNHKGAQNMQMQNIPHSQSKYLHHNIAANAHYLLLWANSSSSSGAGASFQHIFFSYVFSIIFFRKKGI